MRKFGTVETIEDRVLEVKSIHCTENVSNESVMSAKTSPLLVKIENEEVQVMIP